LQLHYRRLIDLRQKINDSHDALCIIEARRRDRPDRYHNNDDSDRFPTFTSNITEKSYHEDFKLVGIPKYDGKQTRVNGFDATPLSSRSQGDTTPPRHSTSR
jgi:hypothetical protein